MKNKRYLALGISIAGAVLDFVSALIILQGTSAPVANDMMITLPSPNMQADWWSALLFLLVAVIFVTGLLYLTSFGMKNMRKLGSVMILYGAIMIAIGAIMLSGMGIIMTNMTLSNISGVAMLVIAVLMIFEGYTMVISKMKSTMMDKKTPRPPSTMPPS